MIEVDIDKYYEELSDAFHFFIELCILSGLDEQSLYDIYFRKSNINMQRIKNGR
jgi:hypothetical protein